MALIKDPFPLGMFDPYILDADKFAFKTSELKATPSVAEAHSPVGFATAHLDDDWCGTGIPILDVPGLGGGYGGPIVNGEPGSGIWDMLG